MSGGPSSIEVLSTDTTGFNCIADDLLVRVDTEVEGGTSSLR